MIVVSLIGGLGNQMFEYAFYLSLINRGKSVLIDDKTYYTNKHFQGWNSIKRKPLLKEYFDISYKTGNIGTVMPFYLKILPNRIKWHFHHKYKKLDKEYYDESFFDLDNKYFQGFFQSEEYFKDEKTERMLREAFTYPKHNEASVEYMKWLNRIDDNTCSLHIRRTDYITMSKKYGNICTDAYYENSINYIKNLYPNMKFFVFSDDKDYIKEKYGNKEAFIVVDDELKDVEDMFLMSACHHHIMANSSFSWWAAWLDNREESIILAPNKWLNNQNYDQIYTNRMIKMDI